jgi:hypothetical protein
VIKSGRIKRVGLIACMRNMRNAYKVLFENPEWKNHFGDLSIDEMIILR